MADSWVDDYLRFCQARIQRVDECLLWVGHVGDTGYANGPKMMGTEFVHRSLWQLENGILGPRMQLRNWCGKRTCVNSEHWRPHKMKEGEVEEGG